jgi:hypothetical protein
MGFDVPRIWANVARAFYDGEHVFIVLKEEIEVSSTTDSSERFTVERTAGRFALLEGAAASLLQDLSGIMSILGAAVADDLTDGADTAR